MKEKIMCMACRRPGPLPGVITMLSPDEEELNLIMIDDAIPAGAKLG